MTVAGLTTDPLCVSTASMWRMMNQSHRVVGHVAGHHGRAGEGRDAEDEHLRPVRVRRGEADGRLVLVVDAVDLVVAPIRVQQPVEPVVEVIFSSTRK